MSRPAFRLILVIGAVLSVGLRVLIPPNPLYGASHDDHLMVTLSQEIRYGNWLGDYGNLGHLTLAKPPGFSMFLAYTHWMPWAPTVTVHLTILIGASLFAIELRRLGSPRSVVATMFIVVCFFPPFFAGQMSRIYREGFLTGLSFLVIGLSARLGARLTLDWRGKPHRGVPTPQTAFLAIALGLSISWAAITKPGWYSIAVLGIASPVLSTARHVAGHGVSVLKSVLVIFVLFNLSAMSLIVFVKHNNERHYGVTSLDTFASGPFADALNLWASVIPDERRPYIVVSESQRREVYSVSPVGSKLEPYLEASPGSGWRSQSCAKMQICDESAAWFPWELRDAIESAGLGDSAGEFNSTLEALASDIRFACTERWIVCGSEGVAPGVLPLGSIPRKTFFDSVAFGVETLVNLPVGDLSRGPYDEVSADRLKTWTDSIRGLPDPSVVVNYRSESLSLGSTVLMLKEVLGPLWTPMLLFGLFGIFRGSGNYFNRSDLRVLFAGCFISVLFSIGQLSALQASSGVFMTNGSALYLLPAFAPLICMAACGWSHAFNDSRATVGDLRSQ